MLERTCLNKGCSVILALRSPKYRSTHGLCEPACLSIQVTQGYLKVVRRREGDCVALNFFEKGFHNLFLTGFVELHRQLVAVDAGDMAIAELDVEHPLTFGESRGGGTG